MWGLDCRGLGVALSWDPSQTVFCDLWDSGKKTEGRNEFALSFSSNSDGRRKSLWHRIVFRFFGQVSNSAAITRTLETLYIPLPEMIMFLHHDWDRA